MSASLASVFVGAARSLLRSSFAVDRSLSFARIYVKDDRKTHLQEEEEERLLDAAVEEGEDEVDESDEVEHVGVSRVRSFVVIIQLGEEGNDLARGEREVARVVTLDQLRQILLDEVARLSLRRDAQTQKEVERIRYALR